MAWSAFPYMVTGEMMTPAILNTFSANMDALSTHQHTGAAGDGNDELSGVDYLNMDAQIGLPDTAGRLQRRTINLLWGAGNYQITNEDPPVGTAGLRSLGSGAQQAAAGNHAH